MTSPRAWLKTLSAGVAVLAVLGVAVKVTLPNQPEWRTKTEAVEWLTTLKGWEGIEFKPGRQLRAVCVDGAWSTTEANSRVIYKVKRTPDGQPLLRSFTCLLFYRGHEWQLYVVTKPGGKWLARRDIVLLP